MERNRFNLLDPLRFVAALSVLLYHYAIYLEGIVHPHILHTFSFGYLGVNFFFLLSGFVISASAMNRSALDFAVSRAVRLYPAFWLCLAFTLLVLYLFRDITIPLTDILFNASILNDYLGVRNIDGVFWTLQAEIKFYACIFLLMLTGVIKYIRAWLFIWVLLSLAHHFYGQPFFLGWFISPEYSFYFIGGVCCYHLHTDKRNKFLIFILCLSLIFASIKAVGQIHNFYPSATDLDEAIAALIVASFFVLFYLLSLGFFNLKRGSSFLLLGAISYPLYLIHNRAGKIMIEDFSLRIGGLWAVVLVTLTMIFISFIIHVLFERRTSDIMRIVAKLLLSKISSPVKSELR